MDALNIMWWENDCHWGLLDLQHYSYSMFQMFSFSASRTPASWGLLYALHASMLNPSYCFSLMCLLVWNSNCSSIHKEAVIREQRVFSAVCTKIMHDSVLIWSCSLHADGIFSQVCFVTLTLTYFARLVRRKEGRQVHDLPDLVNSVPLIGQTLQIHSKY